MSSHLAYLVLGSNLGDRSTNLANAKAEIRALSETRILKASEIYKSPAYGPIDQPFFSILLWKLKRSSRLWCFLSIYKKLKRNSNAKKILT